MAGGGGGGRQVTETKAEFPAEFAPLATSAVGQIQALQGALPLAQFAAFQPQGVPGLSALQEFAVQHLIPGTFDMPAGGQGLLQLASPIGSVATDAVRLRATDPATQSALLALQPRLGGPVTMPAPTPIEAALAASLPGAAGGLPGALSTAVFPGLASTDVSALQQRLLQQGALPQVPSVLPPPPPPSAPVAAPAPAAAPASPSSEVFFVNGRFQTRSDLENQVRGLGGEGNSQELPRGVAGASLNELVDYIRAHTALE